MNKLENKYWSHPIQGTSKMTGLISCWNKKLFLQGISKQNPKISRNFSKFEKCDPTENSTGHLQVIYMNAPAGLYGCYKARFVIQFQWSNYSNRWKNCHRRKALFWTFYNLIWCSTQQCRPFCSVMGEAVC